MELVLYGMEDVMEVRTLEKVLPMRFTRERLSLPTAGTDKFHNAETPFMNTSLEGITKVLQNSHPMIKNVGNIYHAYYYDHRVLYRCVKSPLVRNTGVTVAKGKAQRFADYNKISENLDGLRTPFTIAQLQGRNFIYDLNPVIQTLKKQKKLQKTTMKIRIKVFFDTINPLIHATFQGKGGTYQRFPVFIDLDEYSKQTKLDDYHFLTYLLLAMKRMKQSLDTIQSDYQVLFYTNKGYYLFDMKEDLIPENFNKLKLALKKLKPEVSTDAIVVKAVEDDTALQMSMAMGFTGNPDSEEDPGEPKIADPTEEDLPEIEPESEDESVETKDEPEPIVKSSDPVVKQVATMVGADDETSVDDIAVILNSDDNLKEKLANIVIDKKLGGASKASTKRDQMLRDKQKDVMIKDHTLGELTAKYDIPDIDQHEVTSTASINKDVNTVKYANFQKNYVEKVMPRDIAAVISGFNDKSINMSVVSVNVEDTSDLLNVKETYTIVFEDEFRRRHTVKINLPKIVDGNFIYINGGLKTIETQITSLPVVKTAEDKVYINTNYNKIEISRVGTKYNPNMERFKKLLDKPDSGFSYIRGNNLGTNKDYITCLEYDELSKLYNRIDCGAVHYVFSQELLEKETDGKFHSTMDKVLIGYRKSSKGIEPIYYDRNNPDHVDFIATMVLEAKPELYDSFKTMSAGKKYMYTQTTIMRTAIPTIVLLCFFEGLTQVIRKFNDKNVAFTDKATDRDKYQYIKFNDGYLQYPMSDTEACLLFNGLAAFNTSAYNISDLDDRQTYIDIFEEICGNGYIAGALVNFYDFMIDPITKQLLEMLNLPLDIVSLIIYANNLLVDNQFSTDIGFENYRLRGMEIIPAIMYKQMTIGYAKYRATARNNNPVKISVDPDCVIKTLQDLPTVQDYSHLGPVPEIKNRYFASMRGYVGMNLESAYKEDKRVYDKSMIGVVGVSTDNAKNCGKERHLVLEPNILNTRGMIGITDFKNVDDLKEVQLETAVEMLTPGTLRHDDPVRVAMATKQKGHIIPVADESPMLVSNGIDSMIHYRTTDDYSVVAAQDGKVLEVNEKLHLMKIQYKDGTLRAVDLYPNMAKNSGSGMYLKNQLTTTFKQGDTFKQDAILAYDPYFYKDNPMLGNRLAFGSLMKTAIMSHSSTYEDSGLFTKSASRRMATKITMAKKVTIGKNANVDYIVKRGEKIEIGDELIRFETSFNDAEMNKFLADVRDDLHEAIISLGKTRVSAKYEGTVDDIICYPTIPLEEMSPSLAKVVKNLLAEDKARDKYLNEIDPGAKNSPYKAGCLITRPSGVVATDKYGKIEGEDAVDSVIFKFFITYYDELSDGDKIVHFTANKATMGMMVPEGYEPFSEFRPYEEVSMFQPPSAILQRGTQSIETTMLAYKVLIETKRKMYEILTGESYNEKQKRDYPHMVKDRAPVGESTKAPEIDSNTWKFYLETFDLNVLEQGEIQSMRYFEPGEIVMMCSVGESINIDSYLNRFTQSPNPNLTVDYVNNQLVAKEPIYPGEVLTI